MKFLAWIKKQTPKKEKKFTREEWEKLYYFTAENARRPIIDVMDEAIIDMPVSDRDDARQKIIDRNNELGVDTPITDLQ